MPETNDLHWLAGLLEGEGTFWVSGNHVGIKVAMTDQEPIQKAANLMGNVPIHRQRTSFKTLYYAQVQKAKDAQDLCRKLRPLMSPRRQKQIDAVLERCEELQLQWADGRQKMFLIQHIINEQGMSVTELSKRCGLGYEVVRKGSRGERRIIGKLARYWQGS